MIDPRFPPQPKKNEICLYPLQRALEIDVLWMSFLKKNKFKDKFICELEKDFKIPDPKTLIFFDSASSSLYQFLKFKRFSTNCTPIVAIPAFCCLEVCTAIVDAQAIPVFLDIDANYGLSQKSIEFAVSKGATIIIWPNLFGERCRDPKLIRYIKSLKIDLILDEAQSFPSGEISMEYKTLVSFGATKRLNGLGGGTIIIPNDAERTFFLEFSKKINQGPSKYFIPILLRKLFDLDFLNKIGFKQNLSKELPPLLERHLKENLNSKREVYLMNNFQYLIAIKRMKQLRKYHELILDFYENLKSFCVATFGTNCISCHNGLMGYPSIFAIRIPYNKRYFISKELSDLNIQSTWYYYPLNNLNSYKIYESEDTPNTLKLSSEILIIPFGLGIILKKLKKYRNKIRKYAIRKS